MKVLEPIRCCRREIDLVTIYKEKYVFQCKQCGKIYIAELKKGG